MRTSILILILFCISIAISSDRPRWIAESPMGFRNFYFIGYSESTVLEEAKANSEENAKSQVRSKRSGINISQQSVVERYIEQEPGLYRVWSLVSFPKPFEEQTDPPTKTTYFWRSALLPSYGQFSKGETAKGYLISSGIVTTITSGIVFSNLKITAESDARNSRTQILRDYYTDNANTYNNVSLACFIAATAIYIYNVVDAVAAEGEKVYVYDPRLRELGPNQCKVITPAIPNLLSISIHL